MFKDNEFKGSENRDFETQNITGENREATNANTPVRVLTATSIIGDKVENFNKEKIGEIHNIMLNVQTGCIEYVVMESGGFLGIGEKLFAIPFKSMALDAERKTFLLNLDKDFLKNAPGFDKDHWPETNSKHWEDVGNYWTNSRGPFYPTGGTMI